MGSVPTGPQDQLAPPSGLELASERPTPAGSGQRARTLARNAPTADNRGVAEAERESDGPPETGDWRTSPTTGELEFFDGLAWVGSGPTAADSQLLIRPVPPAEQPPGSGDAAGPGSGGEPG
jgi:hypothetical protein